MYKGERGLWGGGQQSSGRHYYATFRDLMELRVINAFRQVGVSWRAIVKAAKYGSLHFGTDYPYSDLRFSTDGADVFDRSGVGLALASRDGQLAFERIIGDSLFAPLDYVDDAPVRWYPADELGLADIGRNVAVDPNLSFGVPVVLAAGAGVPTDALYRNYIGEGGDAELVARAYEIPVEAVRRAVSFEQALNSRLGVRSNAVYV